jgi:hypothetical protein
MDHIKYVHMRVMPIQSSGEKYNEKDVVRLAAASFLLRATIISRRLHSDSLPTRGLDDIVGRLECLVGYNAIDFCEDEVAFQQPCLLLFRIH